MRSAGFLTEGIDECCGNRTASPQGAQLSSYLAGDRVAVAEPIQLLRVEGVDVQPPLDQRSARRLNRHGFEVK